MSSRRWIAVVPSLLAVFFTVGHSFDPMRSGVDGQYVARAAYAGDFRVNEDHRARNLRGDLNLGKYRLDANEPSIHARTVESDEKSDPALAAEPMTLVLVKTSSAGVSTQRHRQNDRIGRTRTPS